MIFILLKIKQFNNSNWPYIPDHTYRILIVGGSGSGKTNALLYLINDQQDIDKLYLYAKDPYEAKYQYLINEHEKVGLIHFKNIEDYNPDKKRKVLIVFDDMIADMINNKKLNSIVTELFIRHRKLNIDFKGFMKIYKKCNAKPYSFLVTDPTLSSDNPLRLRKNLLE